MPNIITHTLFSHDLLDEMNGSQKELFEKRIQLFEIGSNGPDFLFFHGVSPKHVLKDTPLRGLGGQVHSRGINAFYQKAIECILNEKDEEIAKDMTVYVCGHLCHWALDSVSHPYVYYRTGNCHGESAWWHHRFESLIDAIMLKVKRECTIEDFKAYEICDVSLEIARAIARIYVPILRDIYGSQIKPHQILESLNDWCDVQKVLYDPTGKKYEFADRIEQVFDKENLISGFFVPNSPEDPFDTMNLLHNKWMHPCDETKVSTDSFFDLYDKAIMRARTAITLFLNALANKGTMIEFLSFINDRNYNTGLRENIPMIHFDLVYKYLEDNQDV